MNQYIIISLKHSTKEETFFWRSDDAGYTTNPWMAGLYTQKQVSGDPGYYNNGLTTIAICVTNSSMPNSGLMISVDEIRIKNYKKQNLGEI